MLSSRGCGVLLVKFKCQSSGSQVRSLSSFSLFREAHLNYSVSSNTQQLKDFKQQVSKQKPRRFSSSAPFRQPSQTTSGLTLRPHVDSKYSYAFGRSNEQLSYTTIDHQLRRKVAQSPDDPAFVSFSENKEATFSQLNEDVNKVSKAMVKSLGIKPGEFVGIFAYNCYNWLVLQFACARVGAVMTPINPSYKSHELEFILEKGKIKALFMPGPKSKQSIELNQHLNILQSENIIKLSRSNKLQLESVVLIDQENDYEINVNHGARENFIQQENKINLKLGNCAMFNWNKLINDNDQLNGLKLYATRQEAIQQEGDQLDENSICILDQDLRSSDDLFAVYYTSGTTGTPKGACISQFTVMNNVIFCQNRLRHGRPKQWRAICSTTLPMFHIFAGVLNTLSPLVSNSSIVYSSYKYDIKAFVESIMKYDANLVTLTPTILIDMLTYIEVHKLASQVDLKVIQSGGAALSPEVVERTHKILPQLEELRTGYGSTENGAVATFQSIHEPNDSRPFTVGPPLDFSEVRLVKPNTDELVPHGERGEIQTRGYNTMIGYLDDPKRTKEVLLESRWYKTGDMGVMHPHGSIQISGRLKHLIIKGGENIYPEEVEQILFKLNFIEDIHVVGVPDKRFGEQVCAWIKLKPGYKEVKRLEDKKSDKDIHQADILEYCKDNITYFKIPKYILFVDEFPMTPTKKVQNHLMTEKSIEIFKLQDQL